MYNEGMETTTALRNELANLAAATTAALPNGCNGAGEPSRRRVKIINGHRVTVWVFGWDAAEPVFEVDGSTRPLTIAEAEAAVG